MYRQLAVAVLASAGIAAATRAGRAAAVAALVELFVPTIVHFPISFFRCSK